MREVQDSIETALFISEEVPTAKIELHLDKKSVPKERKEPLDEQSPAPFSALNEPFKADPVGGDQ